MTRCLLAQACTAAPEAAAGGAGGSAGRGTNDLLPPANPLHVPASANKEHHHLTGCKAGEYSQLLSVPRAARTSFPSSQHKPLCMVSASAKKHMSNVSLYVARHAADHSFIMTAPRAACHQGSIHGSISSADPGWSALLHEYLSCTSANQGAPTKCAPIQQGLSSDMGQSQ